MLKLLSDNTWGIIKNEKIIVQAKYWTYPQFTEGSDFHKTGIVGDFSCSEEASLQDSFLLFSQIEHELKQKGCLKIVGPMNGNTWQNYRLTTFYGEHKPFMLEPYTPEFYIKHWEHSGFKAEETYSTYITDIQEWHDTRIEKIKSRFDSFIFKKIEEEDLSAIFDLSLHSFTRNPYYMPISKSVYLDKYGKMMALLKPNLSWVVYDNKELVGYIFAILNNSGVYSENDSVILKTAAISEQRKYAGLGVYLLSLLINECKEINVDYVIHALMHDRNPVQNIIKSNSKKMRGYTLYKKDIL